LCLGGSVVAVADVNDGPTALPTSPGSSSPASPSPGEKSSQATPSQPTPSQPSASSTAPSSSTSVQPHSKALAADGDGVTTVVGPKPDNPTVYPNRDAHDVVLHYSLNKGPTTGAVMVHFRCWMNGHSRDCPDANNQTNGTDTWTGSATFGLGPSPKPYTFTVKAMYGLTDTSTAASQDQYSWRMYSTYAPGTFMPHDGASFNNPISSRANGRKNITRMIRTINAMPGYRQGLKGGACPALGSPGVPGIIHVSLYSMFDTPFAKAMDAASRRCLSVQILMNNHLNRHTDPAWRRMEDALGYQTKSHGKWRRSFAHRCHRACRGGGVLHTKMYLFNSTLPNNAASSNKILNTTFVGSSNMTTNAAYVQWNDLYGDVNNAQLFETYRDYFNLMRKDNGYHRNSYKGFSDNDGKYLTVFWPVTKGHDPEMSALRSIRCSGATGGSGIGGHTVVHINIHAWFGIRGLAFERIVRGLYSKGCYVRILYSFMTPRVYHRLTDGTGGRMQARRTIFASHPGGHVAGVYSHFKNILVSGHFGSDTNAKVTWTGSNNFTSDGTNFDEVMIRIKSAHVYNQYLHQFNYIRHRKSSGTYASFTEPRGGGRAP
jgi:hypothetical protein